MMHWLKKERKKEKVLRPAETANQISCNKNKLNPTEDNADQPDM